MILCAHTGPVLTLSIALLKATDVLSEVVHLPIREQGLSSNDLVILIGVLTDASSALTSGQRSRIIRSFLYFKGQVPKECVYMICSSLGNSITSKKKISHGVQSALLTWLIAVYAFIEPEVIDRIYGLLFNYLEYSYIRPQVAHLLFLATKRHHVTEVRINRLLKLHRKSSSEHIIALALSYREYKYQDILDTFPRVKSSVFRHPDESYLNELIKLRGGDSSAVKQELMYMDQFSTQLKRRKQQSAFNRINYRPSTSTMCLQNVTNTAEFVQCLDTLELSKDWGLVLGDSSNFSLILLALRHDPHELQGLNNWIAVLLRDFLFTPRSQQRTLLENLQRYVLFTGEVPSAVLEFLLNNEDVSSLIKEHGSFIWSFFETLGSSNINDLESLVDKYNKSCFNWEISCICEYLESLGRLLRRAYEIGDQVSRFSAILHSVIRSIPKILQVTQYSGVVGLSVIGFIRFFQTVKNKDTLRVEDIVLPQSIIYTLLFMDNPVIFSEVCSHLNFCKSILKDAEPSVEVTALTNLHNSYVVDICNLTWRNKAFELGKNSQTACGLSLAFTSSFANNFPLFDSHSNFRSLFNLHHTPAFASITARILRQIEDNEPECDTRHEGPLTATSVVELLESEDSKWLTTDYESLRVDILKELGKLGYVGLADLLFSHLKSLVDKR